MTASGQHACWFCVALQRLAVRQRDRVLLDAAIRLREEHGENDAEHRAFARTPATTQPRSSSTRMAIRRGNR